MPLGRAASSLEESPWVRRLLVAAIVALTASILFATWVLGAIPSVLLRMQESPGNTDFYHMPIAGAPAFEAVYQWLPDNAQSLLQLWAFAAAEHLLFLTGILCFVLAILVAVMRSRNSGRSARSSPTESTAERASL
jgi:hypothetical protein